MASTETKHEICSPLMPRRNALRKTCAEIVNEVRQSLRVQSTHRPFTPRDGHRQLFGSASIRDNRPPSAFSLHAQSFDASDSRPGSGTRLSPLDHKPKFSVPCDADDPFKALPKPPTSPVKPRRGLAGAGVRARLLRPGSLTRLPPLEGHRNGKEGEKRCGSEGSVDRLCDLCDRLHGTLAEADMLGRRCKKRSGILRTLFRLIDLNYAQLNMHIAQLCLALCVSGNNLLNICKLIFQISRTESNDILFQNNSVIDSLLRMLSNEHVSASGEAILYCVGSLKFLSGNAEILRILLDKNFICVAQKLIQKLCIVEETNLPIAGHILVQLTTILRNLADLSDCRPLFVSFSILPALCQVLQQHCEDQDVCMNISRIYSKLSSYSECRLALAQTPDCYQLFLELLSKHHQKQDLIVRLLFTLGNLTAKSDEPRLELFQCDGCMRTLLRLYDIYQRKDEPHHTVVQKGASPPVRPQVADDVLVKLVRVLANMCIHPAVGPPVAADTACIRLLMETLGEHKEGSEELLVNVAAVINNLSFYQKETSAIKHNRLHIAKLMLKLLLSSSTGAMLEAVRVYGNLSHYEDVRNFIMQNKVHQFVVTLLDSKSNEMCFAACGVLTNLALDPPSRVCLTVEGASAKLVDCLRDFGLGDWQLAGQICQAVWNLTGRATRIPTFPSHTLVFTNSLDEEEALNWTDNEDLRDFHRACWELEFLPVAQKLMKMLQSADLTA
uniref:Armadillo repeat containing 2 n=1 Tax=Neolamprologus brichardi TaxID=32507 RepID=A0A3Q4HSV8_NEOBR